MKVALLLTGFTRSYDSTYPYLKEHILDKYDVDIYISSWLESQMISKHEIQPINHIDVLDLYGKRIKKCEFLDLSEYNQNRFPPIQFLDRSDDVFKVNPRAIEHGTYWVERLRDQWYTVQRGFEMIDNPQDYDLIMRLRFDVALLKIDLLNKNFVIPKDIGGWSYSDHFAYGKYDEMKKYCTMFDHIETMYYNYNIDISHAIEMIQFYMEEYSSPIATTTDSTIEYSIIKW
jgi:hypothetical protein